MLQTVDVTGLTPEFVREIEALIASFRNQVVTLHRNSAVPPAKRYPLRGTVLRYDNPFEPVALDDWEVLK